MDLDEAAVFGQKRLHPRPTTTYPRGLRGNKVLKIAEERYVRSDIHCGSNLCSLCTELNQSNRARGGMFRGEAPAVNHYVVCDTNVWLTHVEVIVDVFSHNVVLQTVLDEIRHNSVRLYRTVRDTIAASYEAADGNSSRAKSKSQFVVFSNEFHHETYVPRTAAETANDYQDRMIRTACAWYGEHLAESCNVGVVFVSNDAANRQAALEQGIDAYSLLGYVQKFFTQHPRFNLIVDSIGSQEEDARALSRARDENKGYAAHLPQKELEAGIAGNKLLKGNFKVDRDYFKQAFVTGRLNGAHMRVAINDVLSMNRAIDGDTVAVELLPRSEWMRNASASFAAADDVSDAMEVVDLEVNDPMRDGDREDGDGKSAEAVAAVAVQSTKGLVPVGRVVGIVQRNWRTYCGSLQESDAKKQKSSGRVLFVPVDKRIPKIVVHSKHLGDMWDKRIVVRIDSWARASRYPTGHYCQTLGVIGDPQVETEVLLLEHDVPHEPWSKDVLECLPPEDYKIANEPDLAERRDLRDVCVCSIDPPGCTDIDDALHCVELPNGMFQVGVHIADVAHYIKPNSALDLEARNRCTSVYLVDRRLDMIPGALSTDLCSLHEKKDRLAFSVVWTMNPETAEIVDTEFFRSIIHSKAAMTYGQAQARIDDASMKDEITLGCRRLMQVSRILKAKRVAAGALTLASNAKKFTLDEARKVPLDVTLYALKEVNSLVEEFMLLANCSVATKIAQSFPQFALLRRHPTPPKERFEKLVQVAKLSGFDIKVGSSRQLADSLDKCVVKDFPMFNRLIRTVATRCMTTAVYFITSDVSKKEFRHYGLAAPMYTHFTSPIRRYADIVVHRLLAASIGLSSLPSYCRNKEGMKMTCLNINHRKSMADLVSRASGELFTMIFFKNNPCEADAVISAIRKNGIRVLVPRYGAEGAIKLFESDPNADDGDAEDSSAQLVHAEPETKAAVKGVQFDEDSMVLRTANKEYRMFDRCRVKIYVKETALKRQYLVMELV